MSVGWKSDLSSFKKIESSEIQNSLEKFVDDFSAEQSRAWKDSIRHVKNAIDKLVQSNPETSRYGIILEYQLPYDGRRPDFILLANDSILVLEFKGKHIPYRSDLDQVAAYARDLRAYHKDCHNKKVIPILVLTGGSGSDEELDGVVISNPENLHEVIIKFSGDFSENQISINDFTDIGAYSPLPTLVAAARELFESKTIREIWRAKSATDPAVQTINEIAQIAAESKTRHLVLVTGVPGAGKTLVGMRAVHSKDLDELSVTRDNGKSTISGLYLTGNGPLAEVLQYQLKEVGGGGQTFVRHIKQYLQSYIPRPQKIPPEHMLVFDEAQRAFSRQKVEDSHSKWSKAMIKSEPELFINICDRMPEWSVMIGLIGGGQEIHLGEEEGIKQWCEALVASEESANWSVHCSSKISDVFEHKDINIKVNESLNLDRELRFHATTKLHEFTEKLLSDGRPEDMSEIANEIKAPVGDQVDGIKLYATRDLHLAKEYLRDRYKEFPQARFGIIASSRDRDLNKLGITNDWNRKPRIGPWFSEGEENERSCRHLVDTISEFDCQGLELEMALLAWGTDFKKVNNEWSTENAKNYRPKGQTKPVDAFQLRVNSYRVLLTRGRDGVIVYISAELVEMQETYDYLVDCGFDELKN